MIPKTYRIIISLFFFTAMIAVLSLFQGSYNIPFKKVLEIIVFKAFSWHDTWSAEQELIVWHIRLPRVLLVMFVGANLAVSGAVLQAIFKNPLVSPFILGISSGASLGASLVIVFFNYYNPYLIQTSAFIFSLFAVVSVFTISKLSGEDNVIILILAGVIVSTFFQAFVSLMQYFSATDKLQAIVFWNFGSFTTARWAGVLQTAPFSILGCIILVMLSWRINVMSLGDDAAQLLGINVKRFRILLILIVSLMTSSAVAICGPIGWVGLIVPHIVRMLVGSNNFHVLLCSIGFGSSFLLIVDLLSRVLTSYEIPIGIITSIIGAPFFVFIVYKTKQVM